jgi:hypothetical protein
LLRSGFQTLRAELAEAQRAARPNIDGSRDEPLGFSLAMFEHASGYTDIYRALVGGRGGVVAVNEIRRILSETVKKELRGIRDDEMVPQEGCIQFVGRRVPYRADLVARAKAQADTISGRHDLSSFGDQGDRAVDPRRVSRQEHMRHSRV